MSEIQSIANGTYMIGETSSTELQAGPGISITKPSEGTVRISNDETVLWEGTVEVTIGQNLNVTIQLSESVLNFERIVLYCSGPRITKMEWCPTDYATIVASYLSPNSESDVYSIGAIVVQLTDKTQIRYRCGFKTTLSITAYQGEYWGYGAPVKVVGINRISGGN